jgi:hypothetical protein
MSVVETTRGGIGQYKAGNLTGGRQTVTDGIGQNKAGNLTGGSQTVTDGIGQNKPGNSQGYPGPLDGAQTCGTLE